MSAVDWSEFPEPFRRIGNRFAKMLPRLLDDSIPPLPPPGQWPGESISLRRRELQFSQRELAKRVGCSSRYISQIERDLTRPSLDMRERLDAALLPEQVP
jgi:DNA-binding XRE family transcriptional regulator